MILEPFYYGDDAVADVIMHIGTPHEGWVPHSGRYAYGSGEHPYQRSVDFYETVQRLKAENPDITEKELAERLGCVNTSGYNIGKVSTTMFRERYKAATNMRTQYLIAEALRLKEEGKGPTEIAQILGLPGESSARSLLKNGRTERANLTNKTADILKEYIDKYKYVDVGPGVEIALGVTETRLKSALYLLEEQGYQRHNIRVDQPGTDHKTTFTIFTPPDVDFNEVNENKFDVRFPGQDIRKIDINGDITSLGVSNKLESVDSKRIFIDYGSDSDGLIELRAGVPDISLGPKDYAQVRIAVDGTHYLKGMAVPSTDIPDGYDIVFHTNKKEGTPMLSDDPDAKQVLKPMKRLADGSVDWDNPFGASILGEDKSEIMSTVREYEGKDGKIHQSAINVVREEGEWMHWDKNIASQYGSKQPVETARRQLNLAVDDKRFELDEIRRLDNPTVKKHLLLAFADKCDSLAVEQKAAPFRGQQTHVILPCPELGDNEVYAPKYPDGTRVALVRYPFTGYFESPELTVRNTGSPAQRIIPLRSPDAICLNKKRLDQMSGADCDGDTCLVIPITDKVKLRTAKETLDGLKGFDPHEEYAGYKGMPVIRHQTQQTEMGKVTNLITDMSFMNAPEADLVKAVKHSMVIIDAEKHKLDWKRSEKENDIIALKHKYQDNGDGKTGAGTIISRSSSEKQVDERKPWRASSTSIDPETGEKIYTYTGNTYKEGKLNLKNVTLRNGTKVNLSMDKDAKELYYLRKDPATKKNVREYVSTSDLPDNLQGLKIKEAGWINLSHDKKTDRDYYIKTDISTGKPSRVYVNEGDLVQVKEKKRQQSSTKMAEETDAFKLTSGGSKETPGYPMEKVYATFSNDMKGLANQARLEWLRTGNLVYSKDAAKQYKAEVDSLNKKLKEAQSNAPLERQAVLLANRNIAIKKFENPSMTKEELKKKKGQAIVAARNRVGAKKKLIEITDKEYEAIRAGAISETKLRTIMDNTNIDSLRAQATPKAKKTITPAMEALAKSMAAIGATQADIADRLGISTSSVYSIVK